MMTNSKENYVALSNALASLEGKVEVDPPKHTPPGDSIRDLLIP